MNLCIDIGNTNIKLGIIDGSEVIHYQVQKKVYVRDLVALQSKYKYDKVVLGASGRIPTRIMRHLEANYHLLQINGATPLPIKIGYETPETLGRDRIAAVTGANLLYPDNDNCVISLGTCITYDVITKDKLFVGGNIAPGIYLRLKAMHDYTANLPLVEKGDFSQLLGRSTEEALQNGATLGTLLEIESFIVRIKSQYPGINIILTGGDADFFAEMINSKIFVNPYLVLLGLNKIMSFNA